jgi:hypothetical protein
MLSARSVSTESISTQKLRRDTVELVAAEVHRVHRAAQRVHRPSQVLDSLNQRKG